jgi:hypothetical protein
VGVDLLGQRRNAGSPTRCAGFSRPLGPGSVGRLGRIILAD